MWFSFEPSFLLRTKVRIHRRISTLDTFLLSSQLRLLDIFSLYNIAVVLLPNVFTPVTKQERFLVNHTLASQNIIKSQIGNKDRIEKNTKHATLSVLNQ